MVIFDKKFPNKMVVAKKGNPLLIGIGEDSVYAVSEKLAFI